MLSGKDKLFKDFIDSADNSGSIKNNPILMNYCSTWASGLSSQPTLLSKLSGLYIYPSTDESTNLINLVNPSVNLIRKELGGTYSHTSLGLQGLYDSQIPFTTAMRYNHSMGSYITQLPTGYGFNAYLMGVESSGSYTAFHGMYLLGNGTNQGVQTQLTNFAGYGTIVKGLHIINIPSSGYNQWSISKNDKTFYGQYGSSSLGGASGNNFLIGGHSSAFFGSPLATPNTATATYNGYQGMNFITNSVLTIKENNYLYYLNRICQNIIGR